MQSRNDSLITIGVVAKRVGCAVSAIRFYADEGLIPVVRSGNGHRLFQRSIIRRVSFILIAQRMGYSLNDIRKVLQALPDERTPNKGDWQRLAKLFDQDIDQRIKDLRQLKKRLTGCIGCGCLSLTACHLYNPQDAAADFGSGPDLFFVGVEKEQ